MALATKEPDSDERYNPAAWDESTGSRLSAAEQGAFDSIAGNYDQSADDTAENSNIDKARSGESQGNPLALTDDDSPRKGKAAESRDNVANKKDKLALNFMKKKGPLALIGLILAGGGGIFAALLSPGLAIVQLTESLSEDLNDLTSALDERSQHIFRAQMKKQTTGFCSKKVTVRCNYRTMSKKQVAKFAKQGLTIFPDDDKRPLPGGRYRVQTISFVDADGTPRTITAENFQSEYTKNPHFRALMNRAYSPRWMSIRGPTSMSVLKKFRTSLTRAINGKNKAAMADQMDEKVRSGTSDFAGRRVVVETRDPGDGNGERKVYVNPDTGEVINGADNKPIDPDAAEREVQNLRRAAGGGIGSRMTTGLKAANFVGGYSDIYCSVTKMIRMASMAARNIQYAQFLRYAVIFHNTANSIQLGTATPEAVEFLGDIITSKDMREMVLSEQSLSPFTNPSSDGSLILDKAMERTDSISVEPQANPHFGKDAMDSTALKASMHGGGGSVDMLEGSMAFGGGMGNTMERFISAAIPQWLQPGENTCAFWQNPIVQAAGLVISVGALVATGGTSAALQGSMAVGMTAVSMLAMHMLQNKITSIIEGESVTSDTVGPAAGAALFGGSGALFSSMASANGLGPISTIDELKDSKRFAYEEQQRYEEVARLEASDTPFDVHNQYSFLGSMAWNLAPIAQQSSSTVASVALAPLKLLATLPRWTAPQALAAPQMSENRFKQCGDMVGNTNKGDGSREEFNTYEIYKEDNLNVEAVDMMCNLRFGLSEEQHNADPEKVAQWMIDSCQIDATTGNINLTGECATGCAPDAGGENCYRGTTPDQAMALLNAGPDQIASAMRYDDTDIDTPIASDTATSAEQAAHIGQLPAEVSDVLTYDKDGEKPISQQVVEDVRTYAHFMRYCRYGPEDGRTVNFGDPDIELDENGNPVDGDIFTGLPLIGKNIYSSIGRECFASNNCAPNVQNPNNFRSADSSALEMCRPPQYDIYTVYTLDQAVLEGIEMEEDTATESQGGGASTGSYGWPMEGKGTVITSCFAPRWGSFHGALDIAAGGTPNILAADGGEVVMVRNGDGSPGLSGFGESVVIKHADGYHTRYSHMTSGSITVKEGDKVDKGAVIGKQGNTGQSTGPHLDFGISKEMPPLNDNSENPMKYLEVPSDVVNQAGCSPD